ncbi:ABC transporter substrate-binding protein [Devosia ginsengisoli]|uniref:substrate-binding periplasmic protein n=1 Tax=Devosia ginsengisoli TaxID=400770 RepID=UPI0026EE7EE2|nr:transporter substrate-binding domain-containing protein [Devosia ginsengisoli]MCR6670118.1 transporter substrate-binding domain-containing protein [Devosia ginsengisoli]
MRIGWVFLRLTGIMTLAFALAVPAFAQEADFDDVPFADGQWNIGRRLDESQLRYCIDKRDPDWEVAGAIADAIAATLLLEPQRYVVEREIAIEDITRVYSIMVEHCDVHMGFKLIPEGYANWIALTRAYYDTQYVFVASNPELHALADLPPGHPIGATVGTTAHLRLVSYLSALPTDKRWPAYPMGTNEQALESLLSGSVDIALVWAPSLWGKQRSDPAYAELHIVAPDPLPPTTLGVGAVVLSDQKFLRNAIDEAIAALAADGTLAGILESFDFPATVAAP